MTESSLPPPPTHSNAPLIGGVLVALLLVGALVAWRMSGTEPTNDGAAKDALTSAPTLPSVEQGAVPPPPPPPAPPPPAEGSEPEAEPGAEESDVDPSNDGRPLSNAQRATLKPSGAKTEGAAQAQNDGCSGTCPNRVDAAFNQAVRQRGASAKNCYNAALRSNPTLQGKVTVKVRVSPTGGACTASIVSDTLGDPSVTSCILQKFKAGGYPKPTAGCADVEVPLSFVPSGN